MSGSDSSADELRGSEALENERRFFTRLTLLASWRSEYILRTRLLRCLARGRPAELEALGRPSGVRSNAGNTSNAQITYTSNLFSAVNHLHADFGTGPSKILPRFIHGADESGIASTSDPRSGKVDSWGFQDPFPARQFVDLFPGEAEYGLGAGDIVGVPNVMDVSQSFGMLYGEGHQQDAVLWFRHREEKRGRALCWSTSFNDTGSGVPVLENDNATCAVWIAKTANVPNLSEGLVGMLAGSSTGVLTAYSVGTNGLQDRRLERGEMTVRWVLSPGVPIIAINVDERLSETRLASHRIWAVVLNALGEVFYLTGMPRRPEQEFPYGSDRLSHQYQQLLEKTAWAAGRTVHWAMVEPTRRVARVNPFDPNSKDGSYSPRTNWSGMHMSREQVAAETKEVEGFLHQKPKHFRKVCHGWDMRRRLEVDFASSDDYDAGEHVIVISCGLEEASNAEVKRYTRCKTMGYSSELPETNNLSLTSKNAKDFQNDTNSNMSSVLGERSVFSKVQPSWSFINTDPISKGPNVQRDQSNSKCLTEEWRPSSFTFGAQQKLQISASAIDMSSHALLTALEDPLPSINASSAVPSSLSTSLEPIGRLGSSSNVPGYRARLVAIGTKSGIVLIYNMRAPAAKTAAVNGTVIPVRIIHTDSPEISCLAMTALYLVHGGNDGLVQAWDHLASTKEPIRTLNSRFSSLARRRLIQAAASPAGVGVNLFAAGAIFLDPDPLALRGVVSLGSHLRYWSYSSVAADQYKGNKRRLRPSERSINQGDRFSGSGRGALKEYIANERLELEQERKSKRKEKQRLAGRFGIDLLGPGASEDEIMAYAAMLSEEAAQNDNLRRKSASNASSSDGILEESPARLDTQEGLDKDISKVIRESLEDPISQSDPSSSTVPIKYTRKRPKQLPPPSAAISTSPRDEDLEYALQLSLAEQES